ncbi:MATE family efflux transporter [Candidatus Mycoplasma pogonae]
MLVKTFLGNLKKFFPESKLKWFTYFRYSVPVIFSAFIFALNGFIDNFMVTHIPQGLASLSYANSWTAIVNGVVAGIGFVCYTISGQYIGANEHQKVRQIMKIRVFMSFLLTMGFAIPAFIFSREFIAAWPDAPTSQDPSSIAEFNKTIDQGAKYLFYIVITWIILSWTTPLSSLLNETKNGKYGLYSSIISLVANIVGNIFFLKVLGMGVEGAAFASILARVFGIFGDTYFVWKKCPEYLINPFSIHKVKLEIWKNFWKRSFGALLAFSLTLLIIFRNRFFNIAYPQGAIGQTEWAISAALVLGLTGAIAEIFTTTFFAIGTNVNIFVGQNLGKRNFDEAKKNANELKGFHSVIALIFSIFLIIFIVILPYLNYFASSIGQNLEPMERLKAQQYYIYELQMTLLIVVIMNPIWMWFVTTARLISSGGKTNIAAAMEFVTEILMIGWLAIVCLVFVPTFKIPMNQAYMYFFLGDLLKLVVYEIVFLKIDWASRIDDYKSNKIKMKDYD